MKRNAQKETYWREMVSRQARSGLSVSRFCAEREISEASFYGWRKKLTQQDPAEVVPSSRPTTTRSANSAHGQTFIPLAVSESEHTLEVVHPLGYRVRITGEANARSLKQVLDALDQRGEG